jgi:hypothetical protein
MCMRRWLRILFFFCVVTTSAYAQVERKFLERTREIEGIPLVEQFEYKLKGKDTLQDGLYSLKKSVFLDGVLDNYDFFSVEGQKKSGEKTGEWSLRDGALRPAGIGTIDGYVYTFKVEGRENVFKGNLQNGVKNGEWQVYQWEVVNSEISDTLFEAKVFYRDDTLFGGVEIRTKDLSLDYQVTKAEQTAGVWRIRRWIDEGAILEEENWYFEKGALRRKEYRKGNQAQRLNLDSNFSETSSQEWVGFDNDFFELLALKQSLEMEFGQQSFPFHLSQEGYQLFVTFQEIMRRGDFMANMIEGLPFWNPMKTAIPINVLTPKDSSLLEEIREAIDSLDSQLLEFFNDKSVQLAQLTLPEAQEYISVMEAIRAQRIGALEVFLSAHHSGILEKVNMDYFARKIHSLDSTLVYSVEENQEKSKQYRLSGIQQWNESNVLEQLLNHCHYLRSETESLMDSVQSVIAKIQKEESIVLMEERLKELHAYWIDNARILKDHRLEEIAKFDVEERIRAYLDEQLSGYFSILSLEQRIESLDYFIDCLNGVGPLIRTLSSMVLNYEAIEEAYISQVFNPYTFTYMQDVEKPAIYNAFQDLLLPSILGNLHDLRCDNLKSSTLNFDILFKNMMDFLSQETSKRERKVRKVKEPLKAAEILGIALDFN